ncbi:hypothetical protein K227x_31490 [Rubripirellula lacrimiformis]|uniref:Uncharacterized protein n=1 Tax=Rubripirellula lacrimiformis TaxID=1930273 RepID=A0A517NC89_9BACT|nr:hypothetical protein K227x_31490 [Rubripirellula lacrimiformis]
MGSGGEGAKEAKVASAHSTIGRRASKHHMPWPNTTKPPRLPSPPPLSLPRRASPLPRFEREFYSHSNRGRGVGGEGAKQHSQASASLRTIPGAPNYALTAGIQAPLTPTLSPRSHPSSTWMGSGGEGANGAQAASAQSKSGRRASKHHMPRPNATKPPRLPSLPPSPSHDVPPLSPRLNASSTRIQTGGEGSGVRGPSNTAKHRRHSAPPPAHQTTRFKPASRPPSPQPSPPDPIQAPLGWDRGERGQKEPRLQARKARSDAGRRSTTCRGPTPQTRPAYRVPHASPSHVLPPLSPGLNASSTRTQTGGEGSGVVGPRLRRLLLRFGGFTCRLEFFQLTFQRWRMGH